MSETKTLTERFEALIQADGDFARRELEAIVRAEPASAEAFGLLADAHLRRLDLAGAVAAHRAVLALDPENRKSLNGLAFCLMDLGEQEAALEAARTAYRITRSTQSVLYIALLLHRLGRLDEAIRVHDQVLTSGDLAEENRIYALRGMTQLLRDAGQPLRAERYAHELIERFRTQPRYVSSSIMAREQSTAFHEWFPLATKAGLAGVLRRGLAADPGGRTPETFVLPEDRAALAAYAAAQPPGALYIAKPSHGSGGRGIRVTPDVQALLGEAEVVVQRYLERPYLVDGRKGHLRIYAFVTSVDPPRGYIWREGIVRFAPARYELAPDKLADVAMHVTNTALHEGHPELVVSDDPEKEDAGLVWSLSAYLKRMQAQGGHAPEAVFGEIAELVAWTLRQIRREGILQRQAASAPRRAFGPKLLGFDVLLDADAKPWLIELQILPAGGGSPLVEKINAGLYVQMARMSLGYLLRDNLSDAELAAIRRDPAALAARELAIERSNLGQFQPLDLG